MDNMTNAGKLPYDAREKFKDALMKKHKHLYEKNKKDKENGGSRLPLIRSVAAFQKAFSLQVATVTCKLIQNLKGLENQIQRVI